MSWKFGYQSLIVSFESCFDFSGSTPERDSGKPGTAVERDGAGYKMERTASAASGVPRIPMTGRERFARFRAA